MHPKAACDKTKSDGTPFQMQQSLASVRNISNPLLAWVCFSRPLLRPLMCPFIPKELDNAQIPNAVSTHRKTATNKAQLFRPFVCVQSPRFALYPIAFDNPSAIYALPEPQQISRATYRTPRISTQCSCILRKHSVLQRKTTQDTTRFAKYAVHPLCVFVCGS